MNRVLCGSLALLLCSCATQSRHHEAAEDVSEELVDQLERRVDGRSIVIYMDDFRPCDRTASGRLKFGQTSMGAKHVRSAMRLKHQLMAELAPRVKVFDPDYLLGESDAPLGSAMATESVISKAADAGATAILTGDYLMEGSDLLVMVRVLDVADQSIIAAAEITVPHTISVEDPPWWRSY